MSQDIAAVNLSHMIAVTDDGIVCEITNMFDGNGDETDDFNSAVVGIVRVGDDELFTVVFEDYETARVH
ncbi:hypothetical protein J2855_001742 [Agrobacterium tumefaciens]|uniref:hypothetical protein n=1 Tax=Agrobacterium tumefaciens TaxID=358 RepID=UPI000DD3719F|nr:hypothetical protein [Agrobacterium tumefaciens]MBP2508107.1 hypothetical protein [Agrobacterium tumefaciens]MBP2517259.1 hypothetical protein [Agrobacterium tumefaciens]MBP2575893.1 hypothetical protein [Agrobacterium tumefaciens]MBP2594249.1 hypothetical protein [Agrobacterium tumefaciens]